jgi:hypothetical protein
MEKQNTKVNALFGEEAALRALLCSVQGRIVSILSGIIVLQWQHEYV